MRKNPKIINIKVDITRLQEAVENCNLGMGTYDRPIVADYFAVGLDRDNDTIELTQEENAEIFFQVSNKIRVKEKTLKNTPELLDVFIYPSGKEETVLSGHRICQLFEEVFFCERSNIHITDRKLCITADEEDKGCKILVKGRSKNGIRFDFYFNYRILFKLQVLETLYCFSIDPFFRLRSRRPSN